MTINYNGITLHPERDALFSEAGKDLLNKYYSDGKEGIQKAIARAAYNFCYGDLALAQRIYEAASNHWFFFSSPILSNAVEGEWMADAVQHNSATFWKDDPTPRLASWNGNQPKAMPIACFLTHLGDSIKEQIEAASELSYLSVMGGGAAMHSRIRGVSNKAPGPIPYFKTIDANMGYYRQGQTRRGSVAVYLDVSHPDIVEFIKIRETSGGDPDRKITNRAGVHNAVNISQAFIDAVDRDAMWDLIDPHTKEVRETVVARELWEAILDTRALTGEPFLWFIDVANDALPEAQKKLGLTNNGSNLCTEITLPTNSERTAVCCLSSLNLEKYDEWKDSTLVADLTTFLDNVIQWFIDHCPPTIPRAKFSAYRERAIGIGAMGFHYFLMKKSIPFESGGFNSAAQWNNIIFKDIYDKAVKQSRKLGEERGEAPDMHGTGLRNSHLIAIAPNSNSSILCNTSPSIEPISGNVYSQKGRIGIFTNVNPYLQKILRERGQDNDATWKSIVDHSGSVAHLDFLTDHEKKVFLTAWEINQNWIIEHAIRRQVFIDQGQSLNVFFPPGTDRGYINQVHLKAARSKIIKGMYYFKTGAQQKADTIKQIKRRALTPTTGEACLSCEG